MLYISTSYTAGKLEKHLVCFQINPGVFYLFDDLIGVGSNFNDRKGFDEFIKSKNGVEAIVLNGSTAEYTVGVPLAALPGKAVDAINKLIKQLSNNPQDCFYFQPLLTVDVLAGMARHTVRASMKKQGKNEVLEDEITKVTSEQVSTFIDSNARSFLTQRLKMLKAN